MEPDPQSIRLPRDTLRALLQEMGRRIAEEKRIFEIAVYAGSALAFCFDWEEFIDDIDYLPVAEGERELLDYAVKAAEQVGIAVDLPRWGMQIFAADAEGGVPMGEFPPGKLNATGLRIFPAPRDYLLVLRLLAICSSRPHPLPESLWQLLADCEVLDAKGAMQRIAGFFADEEVQARALLRLEQFFAGQQVPEAVLQEEDDE